MLTYKQHCDSKKININNNFIFLRFQPEETGFKKDEEKTLSKSIKQDIQDVLFKTIYLDEYTIDTIDTLKFNFNDVIYNYSVKNLYKTNIDKSILLNKLYKKLKFNNNIHSYMNDDITASKVVSQKVINDKKYSIKTVFDKNDIKLLDYPIVAKPELGHSGLGITVFKNKNEIIKYYNNKQNTLHDLYSEFVDYQREFRVFCVKNKIVGIIERVEKDTNKVNISNKKTHEPLNFLYVEQNIEKIPIFEDVRKMVDDIFNIFTIDVYSIDIFLTKNNKLKLIEINSGTGLNAFRIYQLYKGLMFDSFNKDIDELDKQYIDKTLYPYKQYLIEHYENEISNSLCPIDFTINNDYKIY